MAIELYEHNKTAYERAKTLLQAEGRAAIVHPTGTGKSFIAFKLCEDNPDAVVCWLSPSEYIFRTQTENLKKTGAAVPQNIRFLTYAKLMNADAEALKALCPDYIVLDEFHRCGAEMWGAGLSRLLKAFPDAPVLGLSATAIRYLDNQRNMSDELFGGNVASEMTLGEAIVRGILNPPKYVLSVFSYQKDLEKYQRRVRQAKNKAVRDEGEKYLEALRRALDKAEGLDEIFAKHIAEKAGKYIVFCANYEHLCEMTEKVPEWFGGIDGAPHVYTAYSDDPETSKAFEDFKKDDSGHLKLLFCIDMLNEGIHVEDVNGVILLRPTVSPIIYKQQIGRAMSASKAKNPVIFDIVLNIENLYSIGAIEEEMQLVTAYYRSHGREGEIVNEYFKVTDEVRDCRELFEKLNETLTASWERMFAEAEKYYAQKGDLNVPAKYKTPDGYSLGHWIYVQRKVKAGEMYGKLGEERIRRLDSIGMVWEDYAEASWQRYYAALCRYKERHGDLDIPVSYTDGEGIALGAFVANLRNARSGGKRSAYLAPERLRALDELGMIWDKLDYLWEQNYLACCDFYRKNRHLNIPVNEVAENGLAIGAWLRRQKLIRRGGAPGKLTEEQISRLDDIGMVWSDNFTRRWEYGYERLCAYYRANGDIDVPSSYVDESGFALGAWLNRHTETDKKTGRTGIRITPERKAKLDALGMVWEKKDSWEVRYELAAEYFKEHGNLNVPPDYKPEGIWLNKWLNEQKQIYRGNRGGKVLTREQISRLEKIGMVWKSRRIAKNVAYEKIHGRV